MIALKMAAMAGVEKSDMRYRNAIEELLQRRVPILLIYGLGDFREDFESELAAGLRASIERRTAMNRIVTFEEHLADASYPHQELIFREIESWLLGILEPAVGSH
jgi:hypothetical protein